jgi:hypothetical protein
MERALRIPYYRTLIVVIPELTTVVEDDFRPALGKFVQHERSGKASDSPAGNVDCKDTPEADLLVKTVRQSAAAVRLTGSIGVDRTDAQWFVCGPSGIRLGMIHRTFSNAESVSRNNSLSLPQIPACWQK